MSTNRQTCGKLGVSAALAPGASPAVARSMLPAGKQIKIFLAVAFAIALANPAFAEVPCLGGSPDLFKFVKWDLKTVGPNATEVTLTVHNATNQRFKDSEIKIRWGEWHQFFFRLETLAGAKSDVTFMNSFGMPEKDAKMLQALTPTLCTVRTVDERGNTKDYD